MTGVLIALTSVIIVVVGPCMIHAFKKIFDTVNQTDYLTRGRMRLSLA